MAEDAQGEREAPPAEGSTAPVAAAAATSDGTQQAPPPRRRADPRAALPAALDADMTAMLRMLLPPMVGNIGRSVAQNVVGAVAPEAARSGVLDGQRVSGPGLALGLGLGLGCDTAEGLWDVGCGMWAACGSRRAAWRRGGGKSRPGCLGSA